MEVSIQPASSAAASADNDYRQLFFRWNWTLAAIALLLCLLLAWETHGTNDVDTFRADSRMAAGPAPIELYQRRFPVEQANGETFYEIFNHPPLVLFLLGKFGLLEEVTGLPFHVFFRILSSLAAFGTTLFVSGLIRDRVASPWNLLLYALNPTTILVAGFHGNTDAFMILAIAATVWSVDRQRSPILTGFFFALAVNIKLMPVYLAPALFFALNGKRARVLCFSTVGLLSLAIWTPFLIQDAASVLKSTFGYHSLIGIWGIGYLIRETFLFWTFTLYSKYAILVLCAFLASRMNRPGRRIPLFDQFGILLFLFLFLTPGFGVQYLYWLTPWAVILPVRSYALHWALAGAFLFSVYNQWSGGLPWWYADSLRVPWTPVQDWMCVAAWLTIGVVLAEYHRKYRPVANVD